MRLAVQPVNVLDVIVEALDAVRPGADAKGIQLQSVLDSPGAQVSGDPGRLQQVVWNLLYNAVKFTPKQGRVLVKLQQVKSHVEIVVSDTGQGISAELLPYIFDRLRQGDSTRTRAQGGLGIGLALVRHIAELHGGSVFAESAGEGQGATFVVKLPLMVAGVREHAVAQAKTGAPDRPSLVGVRILVVDDDPAAVELVQEVLAQAGGEARGAVTADEALRMFERWQPDVLVSDIEMPGAGRLHADPQDPRALPGAGRKDAGGGADRVRPTGRPDPEPHGRIQHPRIQAGRSRRADRHRREPGGPRGMSLSRGLRPWTAPGEHDSLSRMADRAGDARALLQRRRHARESPSSPCSTPAPIRWTCCERRWRRMGSRRSSVIFRR